MPELPEVETIARCLDKNLAGKTILDTFVFNPGILHCEENFFASRLAMKKIAQVRRRGKLLIFDLEPNMHLVFHLKMTGKVMYSETGDNCCDAAHLGFMLDDGSAVSFLDQRKFGYCTLLSTEGLQQWDFYSTLGPEPLDITEREFLNLFNQRKARIKALLLDQKTIAGIGNIYADESLFGAGIMPDEPANQIGEKRLKKLYAVLIDVLKRALAAGGSTFRDYMDASGNPGRFQNQFSVYGRKGQPCLCCSETLRTKKVSGRTSTYCPQCQKPSRGGS
ncbi:MAG: bifunctional DNA-formamidopyrimidine glycosylase/DNA-(apurinic or apyrimidinic site) lyase [Thermodesulfobacteriota bacterium]